MKGFGETIFREPSLKSATYIEIFRFLTFLCKGRTIFLKELE